MIGSEAIPNRAEFTSDHCLTLSGRWNVQDAKSIHAELTTLLADEDSRTLAKGIDCRSIESLDLAGIQLVLATRKSFGAIDSIEFGAKTPSSEWFGLCGIGEPNFDFAS